MKLAALAVVLLAATAAQAGPIVVTPPKKPAPSGSRPVFFSKLNDGPTTLRGFVDLHAHLMNHLGFGGHLLHGAPDADVLMPAGSIYNGANADAFKGPTCNPGDQRAKNVQEALGSCYSTHRGHDFIKNKCGDHIRQIVIENFEHSKAAHGVEHPGGFPSFDRWPRWDDINHQQMWVDWIRRARDGGLRVMVALGGNSMTLAHGIKGNAPNDDKHTGDVQIAEMKRFIGRHGDFMQVAYSAADIRRIVAQDKLAVVLGLELDDLGNFALRADNKAHVAPTAANVRAEVQRLHRLGVRYLFPIHVIDNAFGGTALYEKEFWRAQRFHTGHFWDAGCATPADGLTRRLESGFDVFKNLALGDLGVQPLPNCPAGMGHMNKKGLTELGRILLHEAMSLGMLIDVDHAGQRTVNDMITYTRTAPGGAYPVISGHNGLRSGGDRTERNFTPAIYRALAERPTIAGIGWTGQKADNWIQNVNSVSALGVPVAIGSDVNGFENLPGPPDVARCPGRVCVQYSASFPKARHGSREWDYNKEGVAHVGLFPDFLKDVHGRPGGAAVVDKIFDGAEAFAKMWERAEQAGRPATARR